MSGIQFIDVDFRTWSFSSTAKIKGVKKEEVLLDWWALAVSVEWGLGGLRRGEARGVFVRGETQH